MGTIEGTLRYVPGGCWLILTGYHALAASYQLPTTSYRLRVSRGIRLAQLGLLVNALLAGAKLAAGIMGNSYALIADATESFADLLSSLVVWGGVRRWRRGWWD